VQETRGNVNSRPIQITPSKCPASTATSPVCHRRNILFPHCASSLSPSFTLLALRITATPYMRLYAPSTDDPRFRPETDYTRTHYSFCSFPQFPRDGTLTYVKTACFQIPSNSSLTTSRAIKCCINCKSCPCA
jgi:hypothetical protein